MKGIDKVLIFALIIILSTSAFITAAANTVSPPPQKANGTLNIPISVKERNGIETEDFFFRRGIAIEQGLLYSADDICVTENGKKLVSSAEVTERHPEDGSISWLLVSASVDLKPNELKQLYVVNGTPDKGNITYTKDDTNMIVSSDNLSLRFGYGGIESIVHRGSEQLNGTPVNMRIIIDGMTYPLGITEMSVMKQTPAYSKFKLKGSFHENVEGEMYITVPENGERIEIEHRINVKVENYIMIESVGLIIGAVYTGSESGKVYNADYIDLGNIKLASRDYTRFRGATGDPANTGYIIGDSSVTFAPIVNKTAFKFWDGVSRTAHLTVSFSDKADELAKLLATPPAVKIDPNQFVKAGLIMTTETGALIDQNIESFKFGYTTTIGTILVGGVPPDTDLRRKRAAKVDSMSGETGYNIGYGYMQTGDEELYKIVTEFAETWADISVYTGQWPQIDGQGRARSNLWGQLGSQGYFQSHGYYSDEASLYMGYVLSGNEYFYEIFRRGMETTLTAMARNEKAGPGPVTNWYWAASDGRHEPPYTSDFAEVRGLIRCRTLYCAYRLFEDERYLKAAYDLVDWAEFYQEPEGFWYNAYHHDGTTWKDINLTLSKQNYIMLYGYRGVTELLYLDSNEEIKERIKQITLKFADFLCDEGENYGAVLMHPTGDPKIDGNGDHSRGSSTMTNQLALDVLCTAYELGKDDRHLEWLLKYLEYLLASESGGIGMHIAAQQGFMARGVAPDSIRGSATLKASDNLNVLFKENRDKIEAMGYGHLNLLFGDGAKRLDDANQLHHEYPYVTHSIYGKGNEKALYVANNYTETGEWEKNVQLVISENRLWQDMKNVVSDANTVMLEQYMKQYDYAVAKQRPISVSDISGNADICITEYSKDKAELMLSGDFELALKLENGIFEIKDGNTYDVKTAPTPDGIRLIITKGGTMAPINGALYIKFNSKGNMLETIGADKLAQIGIDTSRLTTPLTNNQLSDIMNKAFGVKTVSGDNVPTWRDFAPVVTDILHSAGSDAFEKAGIDKKAVLTPPSAPSDEEAVRLAANALDIAYDGNELAANVFLAEESLYGTRVSWKSEEESILSSKGILNRRNVDRKTITLTATVSKNNASATREFVLPLKQKGGIRYITGQDFTVNEHNLVPQTGTFEVKFSASPNENNIDSFIGIGSSETRTDSLRGTPYGVRFAVSGCIDAINDTWYYADNEIPYEKGKVYNFRLVVRIDENTYDAYVTPEGGEEILIGKNYKGRYTIVPPVTRVDRLWLWSAVTNSYNFIDISLYDYVADEAKVNSLYSEDNLMFGIYDTGSALKLNQFSENGKYMNWTKHQSSLSTNDSRLTIYFGEEGEKPTDNSLTDILKKARLLDETVSENDPVTPATLTRIISQSAYIK